MPKPDQTLDDILDPIAKGLASTAPEPVPEPDPKIILDHIAEVSKNARATGFGLLGLLVFVGITLLAHKDADFFAFGVETQLPLINVEIPVKAFFVFAPALVAALYIYLHLYLITLWDDLADAPARIDGQPLADRVFTWAVSYAALWYRNRARDDDCAAPRALGWMVVAVSVLVGPIFGVAVLALFWWRSMPAHDEGLTLWIGLCFWLAALIGLIGSLTARARMAGATRDEVVRARWGYRLFGGITLIVLACLSWLRTEGGFENYADWIERNGDWVGSSQPATWLNANLPTSKGIADRTDLLWFRLYPANLVEAELTRKPSGWLPHHLWMEDFEEKFRRREGIELGPKLAAEQETALKKEAGERYAEYISQLDAPDLQDADLRNANMFRAFLPGADLRQARMEGAVLSRARMEGADLSRARMEGADLSRARMEGADLTGADLQGADLRFALLNDTRLWSTQFRGANLSDADLIGASARGLGLEDAYLARADFSSISISTIRLDDAGLWYVDISSARHFPTKGALDNAFGDGTVKLPDNMRRPAHWPEQRLTAPAFTRRWRGWREAQGLPWPPPGKALARLAGRAATSPDTPVAPDEILGN